MTTNTKVSESKNTNKSSVSETGHAKIIANFEQLIAFCIGYGSVFNPTKNSLSITEMQNLHQTALNKLNAVKTQKTIFDNATNERRNAFANLKPLATKVFNAFAVSGVDVLAIQDAKSVNKKLQGTSNKKTETEISASTVTSKTISTSQQSYDRLMDHFANLIQVVEQNPIYNPNETDLKVINLKSSLTSLQEKNTSLINSYSQYSNAMIDRNVILYNPLTGLVQTSKEVKQYIKSVFGGNSPQYKQVGGLEFKFIKSE